MKRGEMSGRTESWTVTIRQFDDRIESCMVGEWKFEVPVIRS
jgi:hypothetical protein